MPRTYSKSGCYRCKSRKVKCNEERPVCSACAKWNWPCVYTSHQSRGRSSSKSSAKVHADALLAHLARPLRLPQCCGDEMEGTVLCNIPDSIKGFYSPTSGHRIQDLQTMWQLMTNNDLLRHAGVACFSVMAESADLARLSRETYGKALQSLRSKVLCEGLDQEDIICVIASIVFLGKMESFGPHSSADTLEHWMALIPLLGSDKVTKVMDQGVLPVGEVMLIFESLLYHAGTHALFSRATDRVWDLWQANGTYLRLCTLNPEGPNRLTLSPLLFGQYSLYNMALQVTHLLQTHRDGGHISPDMADQMEAAVRRRDVELDSTKLAPPESTATYTAKHDSERSIYHMFCNSLLICITALRKSSQSQRQQMKFLAEAGMKMFLDLPVYGDVPLLAPHANHFMLAAIWPIQVQACAIYDAAQFEIFMKHYSMLEQFLDAGHHRRARAMLKHVARILNSACAKERFSNSEQNEDRATPVALELLRYDSGLLDPE